MNLLEYIKEYVGEIRNDSLIKNDTPSNVFLEEMIGRLENMELVFNPTILQFYKQGSANRLMKFDSFAYDETDKSLVLLSNEFIDDDNPSVLTQTEINQITQRMINFLSEVRGGTINKYLDPSHDVHKMARDLKVKLDIDYTSVKNDESIERIKLFIITNRQLSKRVANTRIEEFYGRQVELNVWDIERIYDLIQSGRDKEPVLLDIRKLNNGHGLPYLKADFGGTTDYDAYLSILPGKLLSDIYWEHGSRLLEGNVRAFLSVKGKVNKGIRETIKTEPNKFFTYNNGIACTAKRVEFSEDGKEILLIEDIQIINGGQTTASLSSAVMKDKLDLDLVFVPMKLTIIRSEEYDDMIQNISRYANSQNKVTDADLFSNHAFHRRFEELSQKIIAPPKSGEMHSTYWYYERSRGKYQQLQFRFTKQSEKDAHLRKFPKNQVIIKEDLAKYLVAGMYLRPDLVSKGRAKNMTEFASRVDDEWKNKKIAFKTLYFQNAIAYAIIFKAVDKLVANADWYPKGGIKLNIVPYTVSKLINALPNGYVLDLFDIWKKQDVSPLFLVEADKIAKLANDFINNSGGVIPTEYAKKEDTWNKFKEMRYSVDLNFANELITKDFFEQKMRSEAREEQRNEVNGGTLNEIAQLAMTEKGQYWQRLYKEAEKRNMLTYKESDILKNYVFELSKPAPRRIPSDSQCKVIWNLRRRLEEDGVFV